MQTRQQTRETPYGERQDPFSVRVGAEIRDLRVKTGLTLQDVADVFGWGRDAMSKLEKGKNKISLEQYLRIMDFMREVEPSHPGVQLAAHFLRRGSQRSMKDN